MDYAFCQYENFTEGQKVYVRSTLETNSSNGRDSIWRESNLIETGICNTCGPYALFPTAEFIFDKVRACQGDVISFTDISYNGTPTQWLWEFGDGTTDTIQSPTHIYNQPGIYTVKLTAMNANGQTTIVKNNSINIASISGGKTAPFYENFEDEDFPNLGSDDSLKEWVIENGYPNVFWEKINGIAATGGASFGLNLSDINNTAGQTYFYSITSPTVDFSNPNCNKLHYKWAYAKRYSASADLFNVLVNRNCGDGTWTKVFSTSAASMGTASKEIIQSVYKPASSEFKEQEVSLAQFAGRDHILIKFEIEANGGNYFYIDDINIGCDASSSVSENVSFNFEIYPNPLSENTVLKLYTNKNTNLSIVISNIIGQEIAHKEMKLNIGEHNFNLAEWININEKGVFFITIKSNKDTKTTKIIKLH